MSDSTRLSRLLPRLSRGIAAIVVIVIAAAFFKYMQATRLTPDTEPVLERTLAVSVVTAEPVPIARVWTGYGTARAMDSADISAQVSARVVERPPEVEPGGAIEAGQILVRLDATDYEQHVASAEQAAAATEAELEGLDVSRVRLSDQVESAEEELAIATRDLERARSALERGAGNRTDVDQREGAFRRAERTLAGLRQQLEVLPSTRASLSAKLLGQRADLALAREQLARTTIVAPFSGVLQEVYAEPGELLSPGSPVARVVDLSVVEVPVALPISAGEHVEPGNAVRLRADGPTDLSWEGRIARIAPEANAGARTITAFVEVRQAGGVRRPGMILPGQFVVAEVTTGAIIDRIILPRRAVEGDHVLVAAHNSEVLRASERTVHVLFHIDGSFPRLHATETQWAVLASGVEPGDNVIVSNIEQIAPGMRVETVSAAERSP